MVRSPFLLVETGMFIFIFLLNLYVHLILLILLLFYIGNGFLRGKKGQEMVLGRVARRAAVERVGK